jgi:hypothetical protein
MIETKNEEYRYFTVYRFIPLLPSYIASAEGADWSGTGARRGVVCPVRLVADKYIMGEISQVAILAEFS